MEKRALGKGLSALIPDKVDSPEPITVSEYVAYVKTNQVYENPLQPRMNYDEGKLKELMESIKEKGVLQPILVREVENGYEVIAGERRLKAARALNLEEVPVFIKKVSDKEAFIMALIENIQREELNAIEEAMAFKRLIEDFQLKQEDVAQSVGKDRSTISNTLRLLNLPEDIQNSVTAGELSMGHARSLLSIEDKNEQKQVFELVLKKGLSVRELENLIKSGLPSSSTRRRRRSKETNNDLVFLEDDLQQTLGTKVRIHAQKKRGKVIIEYYSPDDLQRIIEIIKR